MEKEFEDFSNEVKRMAILPFCGYSEIEMYALYLIYQAQIEAEHELFFKGVGTENNVKGLW